MTQVTLGSGKKKFTGVHASDPPRSLRLRRSFWKTVSIYPRSAPVIRVILLDYPGSYASAVALCSLYQYRRMPLRYALGN